MQALARKEALSILVCINRYTLEFPQLLSANILHHLISFNFGVRVKFMTEWSDCAEVEHRSDRMSGAWVFRGTRITVKSLFENLEDGATVDEFLEWFPGVTRHQVETVFELASSGLVAPVVA